jgi:hypothetical protein
VVGDSAGEPAGLLSPPPSPDWQAPKVAARANTRAKPINFFIHSSFITDGIKRDVTPIHIQFYSFSMKNYFLLYFFGKIGFLNIYA